MAYLGGPIFTGSFSGSFVFEVHVTAAFGVELIDPVPDLLNGNAVKNSTQLQSQLTSGRVVNGVGADGVTQLVIRIDSTTPGEQFAVTLLNDQQPTHAQSASPNEDGALDLPGGTSFSQSQVTVTTGGVDSNGVAHAFAVYRAPIDFARPTSSGFQTGACNGVPHSDDQAQCRTVYIRVQDPINLTTVPVTIVRPPVILVHGLWSDSSSWEPGFTQSGFAPLVTGVGTADNRFYVALIDYNAKLNIRTSDPLYPTGAWFAPRENSLGYEHNAPIVLQKILGKLGDFKKGKNPVNTPVAAVQVDIVAHSLGGVIVRTLPLQTGFLNSPTYGQGPIHKVITIDTPHLGTPLAAKLLDITNNTCTRNWLGHIGYYSFNTVTYVNGGTDNGAVMELQGNSAILNRIAQPGPRALPAALIAASYANWNSLDCTLDCTPDRIRKECTTDPLAQSFTHAGWPNNFGTTNNASDGIVSVTSQLNGPTTSNLLFPGLAHSPGLVGAYIGLGFAAPSVLDASPANPIATQVISLLNTPVNQTPFTPPINP